jgi:hypothetical protein
LLIVHDLTDHRVQDILKINRFDLPPNIERNPADCAKLVAVV